VCGDAGTNTECSSTFAGHVIISSCTPGSSITFDLVPGSSCTFISAIAQSSSNTCGTATLSNNDKTVNLVPAATKSFGNGNVIRLEITC
jgi:hypothetical protein